MQVNADALTSLQVFENESHASMHSDKTKEGLSLFGILNDTKTTLGRALLRSWLLRPSLLLTVINSRLDAVECFSSPENIVTANTMHNHLKGIRNMPRIMNMLKTGRGRLSDWQGLVKFTFYMAMLRESLTELHEAEKVDVVVKLNDALDIACYRDIGTRINEIVDWEESSSTGRVCVRAHIDEDLDNRKHMYHGINSVLSNVAEQISNKIPPDYASSLNVVYFPQLGYLICIPMPERWRTEGGIDVLDGWTFQFSSDEFVYFKSNEMRDMDSHIGDLHSLIVDRELEIIHALLEEILAHQKSISGACDACAELDCLLSFATASRTNNYTRPEIVEENIINIKRGRHPLQEQVVDTFIENDARMIGGAGFGVRSSEEWNSIILCTGSNACGKSIYLKQIALIQIMAQVGCFVPAESATLGLVDKIFTRVSTRESVSKVQSAFMIDLNQVSLALRNSTARSLIILDEFGKGTLATDGAGIFCGVLKHLLNRRKDCPKVLVATHFHDVFREDILDPQELPITFCHMQVMFTASDGRTMSTDGDDESTSTRILPGDKITYLYRVAKGLSLDSHAAKCAEKFGVPPQIVQRARYVSELISSHELGQLLDEEMTEQEKRDLQESEEICRRFLQWDLQADIDVDVKKKLREVLGRKDST
ncbi:hypothetical protein BDN72DRAFT_832971 [Pluteus cervinus]|uniref:Uncharacterized protein n=1 Tax=Pluteus cervinus TaxID=181527 RepID=A0ACD3B955_9AGAR|nr:hypothetical protein BDN72DRAFT_832971 [Pluteus cervinus]